MIGKPQDRSLGTPGREVPPPLHFAELLPIAEYASGDGGQSKVAIRREGVSEREDVSNQRHELNLGNFVEPVNGRFTEGDDYPDANRWAAPTIGKRAPVMLKDILARIEERLEVVGLSPSAASRLAGLTQDAIRNIQRSVRDPSRHQGISLRTLERLAPVLQTTATYLMSGDKSDPPSNIEDTVPVVGYVGAGAEAHFYNDSQGPFALVRKPDTAKDATAAVIVRGDSLGPFFDRWTVFYSNRIEFPDSSIVGNLCICGLADGRVVIKKVAPSRIPGRFNLLSQFEPPIYDAAVDWAASVSAMSPP